MRFIPNAVSTRVFRQALVLQKHSPNILFGVGVAGVIGTVVLASKATLHVEEVLAEHERNMYTIDQASGKNLESYGDDEQQHDKILVFAKTGLGLAKLYMPAVGLGIVSIAALTKSHNILTERNLAVTAAYATLEKGFNKYRERVIKEFGSDKERELRYGYEEKETLEDTKQGPKVSVSHHAKKDDGDHSIYARFFDELNQNWQRNADYNFVFVKARQSYANDLLVTRGHLFLNEVYDMLGIERTRAGAVVGWVVGNGDNYVDFGLYADNPGARDFVNGREASILLDFNVDGIVYDKI